MGLHRISYHSIRHSAVRTSEYIFNQLIPYIGNKRKLLPLIDQAIGQTDNEKSSKKGIFVDFFAGSGVVSRLAKIMGYAVFSNDWEPYTKAINQCYIQCNQPPAFTSLGGYEQAICRLNALQSKVGWITEHLCPQDDTHYDIKRDRMFYMRKNGMRIDAIRDQIAAWKDGGRINDTEQACLLAPLVYQACYRSNTSGVFKGFHNGWGGRTETALYRIATDLHLDTPVFWDNKKKNEVFCADAQVLAEQLSPKEVALAYLDPPYNQHPYGSNYHVLNSVVLWDKPALSKQITRGTKSAIRLDWRSERRSAYNYKEEAVKAYRKLMDTINAQYILTSYSTDGMIPLSDMLQINIDRGHVSVTMQGYKRYRVSSQRFSKKPMNVEFVLVIDTHRKSDVSLSEMLVIIKNQENTVLNSHPECLEVDPRQLNLF
jgi:adenine-specific DNA-methyltransferase